jgi:hypothetical protein
MLMGNTEPLNDIYIMGGIIRKYLNEAILVNPGMARVGEKT